MPQMMGVLPQSPQRRYQRRLAGMSARRGLRTVMLNGQTHDRIKVRGKMAQPVLAIRMVREHVLRRAWLIVLGIGQKGKNGHESRNSQRARTASYTAGWQKFEGCRFHKRPWSIFQRQTTT